MNGKVLILMGSESDLELLNQTEKILKEFDVAVEMHISSAHRTPERTRVLVEGAENNGFDLVIAAAGLAAHLPGVCAAHTTLPIIGIPVDNGPFQGQDALLSIVQMPPGVPVACMAVGKPGAKNAALFAVQMLAIKYSDLKQKFKDYRAAEARKVIEKDEALSKR